MTLDVHTLFLVTIYVEGILGLLLLFVWAQNMALRAVCWWGFAHVTRLASIALFGLYGSSPDLISIDLTNALLFTAFAMTWTGARVFDGRPVEPVYLVTGAVLWLLVCRLPLVTENNEIRSLIVAGIITSYVWLTAFEFWRGRSEALVSRWPAILMFFAHGALFLLRTPMIALLPPASSSDGLFGSVWMTVLSFEAAAHHLQCIPPACDGEGAYGAPSPQGRHGRPSHRHRQSPVVSAGRIHARETAPRQSASDGIPGHRSRPLQVDQRPLRPRGRRPRAGNFTEARASRCADPISSAGWR